MNYTEFVCPELDEEIEKNRIALIKLETEKEEKYDAFRAPFFKDLILELRRAKLLGNAETSLIERLICLRMKYPCKTHGYKLFAEEVDVWWVKRTYICSKCGQEHISKAPCWA